jgi:deoxyribose-phosphate aldolase
LRKTLVFKAAGDVRTYADVVAVISAGASRIATSTTSVIIDGALWILHSFWSYYSSKVE